MVVLNVGDILYRGNGWSSEDGELMEHPMFFGFESEYVKQYGRIHEYTIINKLVLFDADNISKSDYDNAPANIQKIMNENFGHGKTIKIRDSESIKDKQFLKYLCDKNINGYSITTNMQTLTGATFHNEVAICNPTKFLKYVTTQPLSSTKEKIEKEKHSGVKNNKLLKLQRSQKKRKSIMDEDNEDTNNHTNNTLFGSPKNKKLLNSTQLFSNTSYNSPSTSTTKPTQLFSNASYNSPSTSTTKPTQLFSNASYNSPSGGKKHNANKTIKKYKTNKKNNKKHKTTKKNNKKYKTNKKNKSIKKHKTIKK